MNKMEAVIFDMDGVLINTEKVSKQAFAEAFDSAGLTFTEEIYQQILGRSLPDIQLFLTETYHQPQLAAEIIQQRESAFATYYRTHPVEVKEGVFDLLSFVKEQGLKIAVATSAKESIAVPLLEQSDLIQHFDSLTFGSQVKEAKPHPELFLKAAQQLNVSPEKAYVIEDAQAGIIAANHGGFQAIFIPEVKPPEEFGRECDYRLFKQISEFQATLQ
ncbi:HAD family phosphatase [Enterococcus sp. 669A]|uniref:HAD family phosphatase n=1 Tax=Candidatus Enterococcus moelleringii TaxID=2815325 RepID=A0ABS3L8R2_9ENTE|nr:HAD family phosphatase [Enterococcus sp. 669A]MBO1306007.1 HAD family phosphatase [Enterococcus sp. 669A]